jgi:hypothetical protein
MGTITAIITVVITSPATTILTIARAGGTTDRNMATGATTTHLRAAITRTAMATRVTTEAPAPNP